MEMISYPLNYIEYTAEDVQLYNSSRTSGVYSAENNFDITITNNRQITIGAGLAWLRYDDFAGIVVAIKTPVDFTVDSADGLLNRIDRVVIQFDATQNKTELLLKKGTPASSAVPPVIEKTPSLYELALYDISIPSGSVTINASHITDQRLNEELCGLMSDGVTKIPTEALVNNFNAVLEQLQNALETAIATGVPDHAFTHGANGDDPIEPADIGAANSAHTHKLSDINDLKKVVSVNGNSLALGSPSSGNVTLYGGEAMTVNIKYGSTNTAYIIHSKNLESQELHKLKRSGASNDHGVGFYGASFTPQYWSSGSALDDTIALGWPQRRWSTVYAATSTISTSDAREKRDITDIEHAKALVMAMKPRQYKFNNGVRTHYGFVAQEFEEAMHKAGIDDCAALIKGVITEQKNYTEGMDEDEYKYGLRYEELIAPLLAVVQDQEERIKSLEARLGEIDV